MTDIFNIGYMFDSMCMLIIDILSLRNNDNYILALGMFNTCDLFNDAFWAKESIFLFICSYFIFVLLITGSCDCIHLPQFFFCGARSVFQGRRGVRDGSSRNESRTVGTMYEFFECAFFSMRHTKVDDLEEAVNSTPFSMKAEHCIVNCLVA